MGFFPLWICPTSSFLVLRTLTQITSPSRITRAGASSSVDLTNEEISRYSRHLVLNDVGMKGQRLLKNAKVLVIGAGGLGSPCLLYLAAAGIGTIGIVDGDIVDESNLQRQIIHGTSTVGISKCLSAQQRIHDINPNVRIKLYSQEFTSQTALQILSDDVNDRDTNDQQQQQQQSSQRKAYYDIVVDGSDNFPTKYLINDACDIMGIPWVYSAILAFEGQLSTFNYPPGIGPTYRDLLPTPPPPGDVPSCAEGGVLGVLPGTMGCLQATEVIKIILHRSTDDEICTGRVLVFDALKMKFHQIGLAREDEAERQIISELIDYQGFCAGPKPVATTTTSTSSTSTSSSSSSSSSMVLKVVDNPVIMVGSPIVPMNGRTMDEELVEDDERLIQDGKIHHGPSYHSLEPRECLQKLYNGWSAFVLDVRLQTEHEIVALPFTDIVIPHRSIKIEHIPKKGDILIYCKSGFRGKKAIDRLMTLGVDPTRLYNLEGGILRWQKDIDPSMPRY